MNLDAPRILVLNAGYEPLGLTSIKRGVILVMNGTAEVVEDSGAFLRTPSRPYPVPSVIRLKRMVRRPPGRLTLSRRNIFRRDRHTCQYCGRTGGELTVDHVIPKSRGGRTSWDNLVTACRSCNTKKRNRTPEEAGMRLLSRPRAPHFAEFLVFHLPEVPESWRVFLSYAR
ncbi:HNH endonuclease [Marinithermus hydrothermalis]|uniref:HNH endonuclease n=1 Tax=Marinithermus hydrothermalis (strain DSM 14884 / JCM 11576 / T1) TaxID=869210 RepID=F2NKC0_MARHT|nr:HNH endonuclease [Marinithermus hydrothermalis]AEB12369.1 HNH endonuclease [Marinithermus hydrothermalis DSM 14884]